MEKPKQTTGSGRFRLAALAVLVGSVCVASSLAAEGGAVTLRQPKDHSAEPIKRKLAVVPSEKQIDINRASLEQLKALPGIGAAEAKKIIAGRPYVSKADLVSKKVLPEGLYISIRYRIIAIPADPPKSSK
jgi:DNA uptake protein ComE-like DNA-binding protein